VVVIEGGVAIGIDETRTTLATGLLARANHTGTQAHTTITGLGTAAVSATGDFATAAQGTLAASALQTGTAIANVSGLQTALDGRQPLDSDLTDISALTNPASASILSESSSGVWSFLPTSNFATAAQGTLASSALQTGTAISTVAGLQTALDGKQALGSYATAAQGALADTALQPSGNLAGLANTTTARTNLGLGTAATTAASDYATAAQGTIATSALQSGAAIGTIAGLQTALDNRQTLNTRLTTISTQANPASAKLTQLNTDGTISFTDVPVVVSSGATPPGSPVAGQQWNQTDGVAFLIRRWVRNAGNTEWLSQQVFTNSSTQATVSATTTQQVNYAHTENLDIWLESFQIRGRMATATSPGGGINSDTSYWTFQVGTNFGNSTGVLSPTALVSQQSTTYVLNASMVLGGDINQTITTKNVDTSTTIIRTLLFSYTRVLTPPNLGVAHGTINYRLIYS